MKHRIIKCLTRIPTTDHIEPYPRWRAFDDSIVEWNLEVAEHRVPFFLTLHAHLIIEATLENIANKFLPKLFSRITSLFYDIIHGFVSGYNMKEISNFYRQRQNDTN